MRGIGELQAVRVASSTKRLFDFQAESAYTEISTGDALLCEIHLQRNTGIAKMKARARCAVLFAIK
jgi:hypothetical protein